MKVYVRCRSPKQERLNCLFCNAEATREVHISRISRAPIVRCCSQEVCIIKASEVANTKWKEQQAITFKATVASIEKIGADCYQERLNRLYWWLTPQ